MSAERPLRVAVAKIAQQVAMRILDFMSLALFNTACHSTDWVSIARASMKSADASTSSIQSTSAPNNARSGAKQEQEVRNGVAEKEFYSGVRPIAWTNSSCACE